MNDIINVISSVGFPIVACIFMYKQSNTTLENVTDAITRLNITMQRVCDKLDIEMEGSENNETK